MAKKCGNGFIQARKHYATMRNRSRVFWCGHVLVVSLLANGRKTMGKRIRISSESLNCYGTWVRTGGVDLEQYQRNPVLLWMHWRGMVVGCIKDLRMEGTDITGEPWFDEVREESRLCKRQWEKGTLRMCSPNFEILETSEEPGLLKPGQTRPTITRSKLVEVSMVDIGGNDDNTVILSYRGGELKLAAGEDSEALPLLPGTRPETDGGKLPPRDNLQNDNEKMNEHLKTIALKLGLAETATEADILERIGVLQGHETANKELRKQLDEIKLAGIARMVDDAVTAGKFTADKKEHFINLGKAVGAESLKLTLDSMATAAKPMQLLNQGSAPGNAPSGKWTKLSEVPAEQLKLMRANDPDRYRALYKAEYGIDCPKLD